MQNFNGGKGKPMCFLTHVVELGKGVIHKSHEVILAFLDTSPPHPLLCEFGEIINFLKITKVQLIYILH